MTFLLTPTQRLVLECVRNEAEISRTEIAGQTGLTPGALSRLMRELINLGLVREGRRIANGRGQPRLPILLASDAAWSIGLSFSMHEIEVVAIDFTGRRVAERVAPLRGAEADRILEDCAALIHAMIEAHEPLGMPLLGVGIALPGYFRTDQPTRIDTFATLAPLAEVDLSSLSQRFGARTWVENNSSAAALSEFYQRPDRRMGTLALINVGFGFSAGFVVDGRLYRGRGGNAGEIGRLYPRGTPRPSALDLESILREAGYTVTSTADLARICTDPPDELVAWTRRAGQQLARAIEIVDLVVAPEEVVLGGQIPTDLAGLLEREIRKSINLKHDVQLRLSALGPLAAAEGAAFLPLYHTFAPAPGSIRFPT